MRARLSILPTLLLLFVPGGPLRAEKNLAADPSFEEPKERDQFGHVFAKWGGWIYEGECAFRVANLAHGGKHSLLMSGGSGAKIRAWPEKLTLPPGRYRISAYLRGLDIGVNGDGQSTEFMFDEKYLPLPLKDTFGWTRISYVGDLARRRDEGNFSFGLLASGYLWIDDVCVEQVGGDVQPTPFPVVGREEKPIAPPGRVDATAIHCPECGYRNLPAWGHCYACGAALPAKKKATGATVKRLVSLAKGNPFDGGVVSEQHAAPGQKSLRIERGFASLDAAQDWSGFDYVKADVFTAAKKPLALTVEVRDRQTRDYWSRVNYTTVVPPGASTLIVPTALYVGEKARPGRALILDAVTRLVFALDDKAEAPLFLHNLRLERDTEIERVRFDGLWAFDVGPAGSPLMEGFTPLDASKFYSKGRGYGWKNARIWRSFDALQPDPLFRDFICVEKGGLAIDVPNGKYHVFVNQDSPSGFWGEYQIYRSRALIVEGNRYEDHMDLASFKKRYFRYWNNEDLPSENTFDKYQLPYFGLKHVIVDVNDGQLNVNFEGENWANCVSMIVVYPDSKAAQGRRFMEFVGQRRRFHFDNAFKRVLHSPSGDAVAPSAVEKERGFVVFDRAWMRDVYHNDRPLPGERVERLRVSAFAGELEPITVSLVPLKDAGPATLTVSDVKSAAGDVISSKQFEIGYVLHRITRVTGEGSVYTIAPRHIIPRACAPLPAGVTRTFWLTLTVPADARPGTYRGAARIGVAKGGQCTLPLEVRVRKGSLDAVDVPAGPFGYTLGMPWFEEESADWNRTMAVKSLRKLRQYGFTTVTGVPMVSYQGFKDGRPQFDFSHGDEQMKLLRDNGFRMPVVAYGTFEGLNTNFKDEEAMKEAGFNDYSQFLRAVFGAVQRHADASGWLPVYWNIGDEPVGDDVQRSAENAEAFRKAFADGPPWFTAADSFSGGKRADPHFRLARALHVADWNDHDETSVKMLRQAGGSWAYYNSGNRWTYGVYLFKAAKQFDLKYRISWYWNAAAGDPFYGLDCREDDSAWCSANGDGELLSTPHFERLREGLDDYRRLLTLRRLATSRAGTPAARRAEKLLAEVVGGFRLGDRELKGVESFAEMRERLDAAIESLR